MELIMAVLGVLADWFLRPGILAAALLLGGLALLALVFKVGFFTAVWAKLVEAFNSVWNEAMDNPHVYILLGVALFVDAQFAVIGALAYVVARAVMDKLHLKV